MNERSEGVGPLVAIRRIDTCWTKQRHEMSMGTPRPHAAAALIGETWLTTTM